MMLQGIFRHNYGPQAVRGSAVYGWPVGGVGTVGGWYSTPRLPPTSSCSPVLTFPGLPPGRRLTVHATGAHIRPATLPCAYSPLHPSVSVRYRESGVFPLILASFCVSFPPLFPRRRFVGRPAARVPRIAPPLRPVVVPGSAAHASSYPSGVHPANPRKPPFPFFPCCCCCPRKIPQRERVACLLLPLLGAAPPRLVCDNRQSDPGAPRPPVAVPPPVPAHAARPHFRGIDVRL